MKKSYKTFTYPEEYNEIECEEFINHFKNLAFHISLDCLKLRKLYCGLDLMRSAALEGCFKAYLVSKKVNATEYLHQKGLVRICVKRAFWSMARAFGYLPSQGQIFFPKEWIDYQDYFKDSSNLNEKDLYNEIDAKIINNLIASFPDKEVEIHQLYMAGYEFSEIAGRIGYSNRVCASKMYARTLERAKKKMEPPIDCKRCGKKFRVGDGCSEFCSRTCSRRYSWNKYNKLKV